MEHSHFHKLSRIIWAATVTLIVTLAVYVSFGRLLMANIEQFESRILQQLNSHLPFRVEANKVRGEWHFFSPELVFSGLEVTIPDSTEPPYRLNEGRVTLDVLDSLSSRSLQVSKLRLDALSLRGELSEDGKFTIIGFGGGTTDFSAWLEQFLLNIESVDLTHNTLALALPNQQQRQLQLDLGMRKNGSTRVLEAKILSHTTGTAISLLAKGVGNPLHSDTFTGELYLNAKMAELSAVQQLFSAAPNLNVQGGLNAQLWLVWEGGEPTMELGMEGRNMVFSAQDKSWQLPADKVSLRASLVERRDQWTVFVSDFQFQKDEVKLLIPRLQLDAWGDSIRLRAENTALGPFTELLVDMSVTPSAIADVFDVLNTHGELSTVQLGIADVQNPGKDWQLFANFRDLAVDSWRGAPGVRSAKGYVELAPKGGSVILDSQNFAMNFPTVYKLPLFYEDFFGTIDINWDADDFTLSSGLLAARGKEGLANVVFGLNIPLEKNDVGLEMDLLVGLEDFDPKYREKYLPYILSDSLLGWLRPGIGAGRIEQGAFLWRGNLRANTPKLKTIQLFFNVAETQLNYHPDWPPVSNVDAIIFIDDTDVSVWSESANLYQSKIQYLSAEAWMDESHHMVLAIGGSLEGSASDGLRVVNNSPIKSIVGPVFDHWEANGQLFTDLQLQVVLAGDAQPPDIDVKTRWQNVDLKVNPGNIPVTDIDGEFFYNSETGFSSKGLQGKLWGQDLNAQFHQNGSALDVALSTRVEMADVQNWLGLNLLAFASGEAKADINIHVIPKQGATLSVASTLQGVALDLPQPWGKQAETSVPLQLSMPLGGDTQLLDLSLDSGLQLQLELAGSSFTGAALALNQSPARVEPGILHITGHSPLLDVEQWQGFVERYIEDELLASLDAKGGLSVKIDRLGTDTLLLMGQDIPDVIFSMESRAGAWDIVAETRWASGQLQLTPGGREANLDIQFLDLDQLEQLQFSGSDSAEPPQLPDMQVSMKSIYKGGQEFGKLDFSLANEGSALVVSNLVGTIAGLEMPPQSPAILQWSSGAEGSKTELEAVLQFGDLSHTLELLGYQQILETEKGQFDISLEWPGGPQNFALEEAEGSLSIAVNEGRFIDAPAGAAGALRVLSILNLAEIISRLSLTHMFESGIPFHSVDGEVLLADGHIEVVNMEVDGSTSGFQFSGIADVTTETLEGNLAVTLPVANNLPWIVALTAGLPVAAGVFVVSKVFQKQVDKFSSGVYQVSGSWDDPKLEFVRIFDDASRLKKVHKDEGAAGSKKQATDPNAPGGAVESNQVEDSNQPGVQSLPE